MRISDERFANALEQMGWRVEERQRIPQPYLMNGIVGMATLEHKEKGLRASAEVFEGESLWELSYRKARRAEQGQLQEELRDSLHEEFANRAAGKEPSAKQMKRNYEVSIMIQAIEMTLDAIEQGDELAELAVVIAQGNGA